MLYSLLLLLARLAQCFVVDKIDSTLKCREEELGKPSGLLANANVDSTVV